MKMETLYYGDGSVVRKTEDGRKWREASQAELARLEPDALVFMAGSGEPKPVSHYDGYYLAGGYPFLLGIACLLPVYVEAR